MASAPPSEVAARRAAWWQERGRREEREQGHVYQTETGRLAGLVLDERQGGREGKEKRGGRSMKVGARLVFRLPDPPTDGSPSACC
jgi:hypothetical protein